jgi:hypothetical protein
MDIQEYREILTILKDVRHSVEDAARDLSERGDASAVASSTD